MSTVSLVHHLRSGPLVNWITSHCPRLPELAATTEDAASRTTTVRPRRGSLPISHYAAVGSIVGQRLADAIEPAPPYPALYGAVTCSALGMADAGHLACRYPTHHGLPWSEAQRAAGVHLRPTPTGWWQVLREPAAAAGGEVEARLVELIEQHRQAVEKLQLGQLADRATEAGLVPLYSLLQQLEAVYRGATDLDDLQRIADTGTVFVDHAVLDDVLQVLPHNHHALRQIHALAGCTDSQRLGHAAPVLRVGWAEADLLVGPHPRGGYTLLDVKTVTAATERGAREWITQILAYALLDDADRWLIRRLGLWLPRQGVLVGWQLGDLLDGDLAELRAQFAALVDAVLAAESVGNPGRARTRTKEA